MAPTNRLIEARRAQLRAQDEAAKRGDAKAASGGNGHRSPTARPKPRPKAKG